MAKCNQLTCLRLPFKGLITSWLREYNERYDVCVIVGCTAIWVLQPNTNEYNGQSYAAMTLVACQAACYDNASCIGLDWIPNNPDDQYCWLSGPWSTYRSNGMSPGIDHYDLTRFCGGRH